MAARRSAGAAARAPVAFVVVGGQDRRRAFRFAAGEAHAAGEVRLSWYEPTVLRARLEDAGGRTVPARVAVQVGGDEVEGFDVRELDKAVGCDGIVALPVDATGLVLFAVVPEDPARSPRLLPLALPERGDGPWTARAPEGKLLVDVRDEDGAAIAAVEVPAAGYGLLRVRLPRR